MSNPAIRFRSLTVSQFRGIPQPVTVDLTAPLTVIHAPNGTGKTSLCQAVEWLLTGKVESVDDDDIPFRLMPNASPSVSASLALEDEDWQFEHDQGGWWSGRAGEKQKRDREALSRFAPSVVEPGGRRSTRSANDMRKVWLKGTRFLLAEDLAVLIDSDSKSKDRREEVFADLLGIRHLLDADKALGDYLGQLQPEANRTARLVTTKETELAALPDAGAESTAAQDALAAAEGTLWPIGRPATADTNFDARLSAASGEQASQDQQLARRRQALSYVETVLPRLEHIIADAAALQSRSDSLERFSTRWNPRLTTLETEIAQREALALQAKGNAAVYLRLRHQIRDQWNAIAPALSERDRLDLSRGAVTDHFPMAIWSAEQRDSQRTALTKLRDGQPDQARRRLVVDGLRIRLVEIAAPTVDALAQADTDAHTKEKAAADSQRAHKAAAGTFDTLRLAGRAALAEQAPDDGNCPLCHHPWPSGTALREAVEETLATAPGLLGLLEQDVARTKAAADDARKLAEDLRGRRRLADQLEQDLRQQVEPFAQLAALAEQLGLSSDETAWVSQADAALAEVTIADGIAALLATVDQADDALGTPPRPATTPLEDWSERTGIALEDRAHSLAISAATDDRWTRKATKLLTFAALRVGSVKDRHATDTARLSEIRSELARFREDWQRLTDSEPGDAQLAAMRRAIISDDERLAKARACLAAATAAQSASIAWQRRQVLTEELKRLRAQRDFLASRVTMADETRKAVTTHQNQYVHEQLRGLMPTVRTLFARVHANRVFDSIRQGEGADPLRWMADVGDDRQFEPDRHFSQGQRQDLALALFLARACALGGTFFLDEPLAHLDDLNRVAVLDILRVLAVTRPDIGLVLTTASRPLVRHLIEKFRRLPDGPMGRPLNVITLDGNPRQGVRKITRHV